MDQKQDAALEGIQLSESANTSKEAEDCSIVNSKQEEKLVTQIEDDFKKQLSEYLYVKSFTDMPLEERNILRELSGFPPRFEPVSWTQSCIQEEEQCCIGKEDSWNWCDQEADGSYSCGYVEVGSWQLAEAFINVLDRRC